MGWKRRLDDAKHKHRPRLKDWSRDGFATTRAADFEALAQLPAQGAEGISVRQGAIARTHARGLSVPGFIEKFEKTGTPVVIEGVPEREGWAAPRAWASFAALKRRYRRYTFKCGEDDDGKSVRVRLKHFFKYCKHQQDDSPLYIFDSTYDDDREAKGLLEDYAVPSYFPDDLFSLVGEKRRPPYRWFLVGPKRSGTCVHIDPLGTSAWNTVVTGRKRWVLFPPGTPKDVVKGKGLFLKGEDDEPVNYFVDILPRLRQKHGPEVTMYEFIQEPGETVFVPGGWWHAVINLEDSVAVTQNFCSRVNFPTVWRKTRSGRKGMARKWLRLLEERYPDLGALAKRINEVDGWHMPTPEERLQRKREKKEKKEAKKRRKEGTGTAAAGGSTSSSASSSAASSDAEVAAAAQGQAQQTQGAGGELHKRKGEESMSEQQKRGRREGEMAQ